MESRARAATWGWLAGAWALGMALVHRPMFVSGFALQHGDPGDTRLNNYFLEHSYRWALQRAPDTSLWDMPFFHPAKNVGAYSDVLLGVGPFYWPWRAIGFEVDTAMQLWFLTCSTLNLLAAYFFLLRAFRFRALASAIGAFVFAFALARSNQLNHPQLVPEFWSIWALHALAGAIAPPAEWSRLRRRLAIAAFFGCVALQLWSGFYLGWYFGLGLAIALAWALAFAAPRRALVTLVRAEAAAIAASAVLAVAFLWPMVSHYLEATRDVGVRQFEHVVPMIPRAQSWIHVGVHSWFYAWTMHSDLFALIPVQGEHRIGVGLLTTGAWIAGLVLARKRPLFRVVLLTAGTVMLLATTTSEGLTLWRAVHAWVPGGKAIRAVARIGVVLLVPISIGVAAFVDAFIEKRKAIVAWAVGFLCVIEQGTDAPMFDKHLLRGDVTALASRVPAGCASVLFSPRGVETPSYQYQLDAMLAAQHAGIPTVNGYSGNRPPAWDLERAAITTAADATDRERVEAKLREWTHASGLDPAHVCHVIVDADPSHR